MVRVPQRARRGGYVKFIPFNFISTVTATFAVLSMSVSAAESPAWTLEASVQRARTVAPELSEADARVRAREGAWRQAGAWPNPAIEVRGDQRLSMEAGGSDLGWRYAGVSQSLPITRLTRQRRAAGTRLAGEQALHRDQGLQLEYKVAQAFHALQLAAAHHDIARERHDAMETIIAARDRLVRYLAPTDRLRLDILRAQADQAIATTEGEHAEAAARLRALLALPPGDDPRTAALVPMGKMPPLAESLARLAAHPASEAARLEHEAARAETDAARTQRFADPAISLFRERDVIGGVERNYSGVGLSVQLPLWNLNNGGVRRAEAEKSLHETLELDRLIGGRPMRGDRACHARCAAARTRSRSSAEPCSARGAARRRPRWPRATAPRSASCRRPRPRCRRSPCAAVRSHEAPGWARHFETTDCTG